MKLLRLAPENTKFPFMRFRRVSYPFSALLSLIAVALFIFKGMNFGIDFAGGTVIELRAKSGQADIAQLRTLGESLKLGDIEVQAFGNESDATLRFGAQPGGDAAQQAAVEKVRGAVGENYDLRRVEVVGPRVSGELVQSGTLGVVLSIFAVLSYLWFRFEWQFALGAVIATMHDLLLTVGFFSITQLEFNTTSIAAILTIVGYSLNETVVVLDRIRENMRKYKRMSTAQMIDMSINAVLPRTIMTATTVMLALIALVVFGGQVIRSFSLAMIWGIFVATYSSIFICSPMLIYLGLRNEDADRKAATVSEPEPQTTPEPEAPSDAEPAAFLSVMDDVGDAPVPAAPKRPATKQQGKGAPKSRRKPK
ncbi:MAG: protein translocase subunit SecF [Methylocystis sp.]|nr:protein translocase subunit SecF [Methylocystis sp.]